MISSAFITSATLELASRACHVGLFKMTERMMPGKTPAVSGGVNHSCSFAPLPLLLAVRCIMIRLNIHDAHEITISIGDAPH